MPTVPVRDIKVQPEENDLIVGTQGRSIYILDDLSVIQQAGNVVNKNWHVFSPYPAYRMQGSGSRFGSMPHFQQQIRKMATCPPANGFLHLCPKTRFDPEANRRIQIVYCPRAFRRCPPMPFSENGPYLQCLQTEYSLHFKGIHVII